MTNATWQKLCNEWLYNEYNDFAKETAKKFGVSMSRINALNANKMQTVRKVCKANSIWLEDFCESDIYIELMPFGGYTKETLNTLIECIDHYRKSGRSNAVYKTICRR